ncbi:hypothetical protein Pmani_027222 [Petrolisthes manimaculis]|uniref:Serpin domain-containing protein n=1 Tax=Petrolisthes manimaculis TaxID=1843537 RepID=A0AAE1P338_9EUCA|nr:hypothetical protein Pmani_027222 [Petrolisthes manimaculis]
MTFSRCSSSFIWQCLVMSSVVVGMGEEEQAQRPAGPSILAYPHQEAVTMLTPSQNNFTRDLYITLARGNTGNLFFSPFSVMAALAMTYGGAGGKTREQMHSALRLVVTPHDLHHAFHDLLTDMKRESPDFELRTSNLAYISDKLSVSNDYLTLLHEQYLSLSKTVDFSSSDVVRMEINSMVEQETNSLIKDLIPPGVVNSKTRMVLVNAVYFKGLWESQFKEASTTVEDFWISEKESIKTPMMHSFENFRFAYSEQLEASLLALDYQGSRLSMVLVLPTSREGLGGVEAKLAQTDFLNGLDGNMGRDKIQVSIPKFKLEESLDLVGHLRDMGMSDLFDESACDLSGISDNRELYVSQVLHKAFLEVNEKGTEAAAATGVVMMKRSLPTTFIANHPFLFYIRDAQSGLVLFAGRLVNPGSHNVKDEL